MVLVLVLLIEFGAALNGEASATVTYRLKWLFNTSVVGDLYADVHRFFADQGLTVVIKEGGPERDAIRELERAGRLGADVADRVLAVHDAAEQRKERG